MDRSYLVLHRMERGPTGMLSVVMRIDEAAVLWLSLRRNAAVSLLMKGVTRLGDGYVWAATGVLIWMLDPRGDAVAMRLALAFGIELTIYKILKRAFGRPRPFVRVAAVKRLVVPPDEYSFPSGHTAAAFVMVVVIGASWSAMALPLLAAALLVGLSRVYLGVHYPSDVVAGALLGIASGAVSSVL